MVEIKDVEILLVEDSMVDARFTMASLKKSEIPHRLTLVRDGDVIELDAENSLRLAGLVPRRSARANFALARLNANFKPNR